MKNLQLNEQGLMQKQNWREAQIALPSFDWRQMRRETFAAPRWVHFGEGNIFRGFIAGLQQRLLNQGLAPVFWRLRPSTTASSTASIIPMTP